jgi:hypothetical protein
MATQSEILTGVMRRSTAVLATLAVAGVGSIGIALGAGGGSQIGPPPRGVSNEELRSARSDVEHAAAREVGSDFACVAVDQHRMKIFVISSAARAAATEFKEGLPFASQVDVELASARFRYSTMVKIQDAVAESRPRGGRNSSIAVSSPQSQSPRCTPVKVAFHGGGTARKRWQRQMLCRYGADRVQFVRSELIEAL